MKNNRTTFFAGVVLVLAALAVYRNSLDAPFLFDDSLAIVQNKTIRHLWPLGDALSPPSDGSGVSGRPLVNLSFAINHALGGLEPPGYHVGNLLLHILASLALWGLLRRTWRMLDRDVPGDAELLAFATALLWTVHPLLTESVVCSVQRNEVMGGLFYLLTLYCFARGTAQTGDSPRGRVWLFLSWIACLLGMASKEIVASAPLLVLLYDRTFVAGTFPAAWRERKRFYGALAATWLLLAWLMWHNRQRGGTVGFGLGVSSWDYLLTQCRALTIYLKLSFWPHPLIMDYGTGLVRQLGEVWLQGTLIVALLVGTVVALWRRPVLGFVGATFFVILAPSSSIVPLTTQTIAEHRMYLPLASVLIVTVAGLHAWLGRRIVIALFLAAAVLGVVTTKRNAVFLDDWAIWNESLEAYPENARAHSGVGTAYYKRGQTPEALPYFEKSLQLAPLSAFSEYNLGLALEKLERHAEALVHFREAVRLGSSFAPAQTELGALLQQQGKNAEAIRHLETALASDPDNLGALNSLGGALAGVGRIPEAIAAYEKALGIDPKAADVHFNYALLLVSLGRKPEAMARYEEAIRLDPRHAQARLNLGIFLAQAGRIPEALVQLRAAVALKPDLVEGYANLGIALTLADRPVEAVANYEEAIRLRPDYAVAHYNLGNALLTLQRWSEAKRHFAEAVRLSPENAAAREMLEQMKDVSGDSDK